MSLSSLLVAVNGVVVPEDSGGPYVAAAYVIFLVLIALYVAIMAQRLSKISKQAAELEQRLGSASTGAGAVQGVVRTDGSSEPQTPAPSAGAEGQKVVS